MELGALLGRPEQRRRRPRVSRQEPEGGRGGEVRPRADGGDVPVLDAAGGVDGAGGGGGDGEEGRGGGVGGQRGVGQGGEGGGGDEIWEDGGHGAGAAVCGAGVREASKGDCYGMVFKRFFFIILVLHHFFLVASARSALGPLSLVDPTVQCGAVGQSGRDPEEVP